MLDRATPPSQEDALAALRARARVEDAGADIGPSIRRVLESGLAESGADLPARLVAVAEANLPVARLLEGHVNAVELIARLGGPCDPGRLHGVWGADGATPVALEAGRLTGGKRYASGLGTVERAVVTVGSGAAARLAVVDVTDPARHRPATWAMHGMRATVSGDIDLSGLRPDWIGSPGDYFEEPHFLGGVWRIAACQLGGTLGLLAAARDALAERGYLEAPAQLSRLGPLVGRAMAGFGLVERAAAVASGPEGAADPERAVALSIQARLLTEEIAQDAIAATERSVGLPHFAEGAATLRMARDLATYCRQAARDAFEQRAAAHALGGDGPLSTLWTGAR